MPDLLWDDVRDLFEPTFRGVLPDVHVAAATSQDWQDVVDLIRSRGLRYEYAENGLRRRLPTRIEQVLNRRAVVGVALRVWLAPEVLAIFHFSATDEIDFDVDLRELQGQDRLDALCAFFRIIGRKLRKPVVMMEEGTHQDPMIGYDPNVDRVVRLQQGPERRLSEAR